MRANLSRPAHALTEDLGENTELRVQVQAQRKTVSELQSQLAEAQASEANIKFKASTLEQQISLHEQSNEQLNVELSKQLARHAELRKSATEEVSRLQSELDQKVSECDEVSQRYRTLRNTHNNLDRKLHETLNKNRELQLEAAEASRSFQEEIQAYKHVLEQHERMSTETRARINEIEREETALRETLQKRETALISQAERERERSGALRTKVEELEGIIHRMQSGELPVPRTPGTPGPDGSLILSPTASVVARLQRGGKSITEVYADYVRIQKELQLEKQEKNRLETTLNDIFNEIQDRVGSLLQLTELSLMLWHRLPSLHNSDWSTRESPLRRISWLLNYPKPSKPVTFTLEPPKRLLTHSR